MEKINKISYKTVLVVTNDGETTKTTLAEYQSMALLTYELDDIVDDLSCLPLKTEGKWISVETINDAPLYSISLKKAIDKIKNSESIID